MGSWSPSKSWLCYKGFLATGLNCPSVKSILMLSPPPTPSVLAHQSGVSIPCRFQYFIQIDSSTPPHPTSPTIIHAQIWSRHLFNPLEFRSKMYLLPNTHQSTVTHMCLLICLIISPTYFSVLMAYTVSPTKLIILWVHQLKSLPSGAGKNVCLL